MSRSDLEEIQKQLKVAIQNHQMLMAQRKNPQDMRIQQRIRDTQREISSLGEKQKGILQILRKASNPPNGTSADKTNLKPNCVPGLRPLLPAHTPVNTKPLRPVSAHTMPVGVYKTSSPITNNTLSRNRSSATVTIPIQAHTNSVGGKPTLVLPANLSSLALTLRPNTTLTLPMSTGGSLTLPASALPPHLLKPGIRLTLPLSGRNIPFVPVRPKTSATVANTGSSRSATSSPAPSSPSNQRSGSAVTSQWRTGQLVAEKAFDPERLKQDFMATLDLVSPERKKELESKRSERKRRTTANPNFSYSNNYSSERKYSLTNYLNTMHARRHNRQRVESPLPPARLPPSPCSANGVQGHNYFHNGESMDVHDDYCAVCRRSGQLLMCDTCSLVYHLHCLNPPLSRIPTGVWRCPKCEIQFKKRQALNNRTSPSPIRDNNNTPQKPLLPIPDKSAQSPLFTQSLTPPNTSATGERQKQQQLVQQRSQPMQHDQQPKQQQEQPEKRDLDVRALSTLIPLVVPKPTLSVPRSLLMVSNPSFPGKAVSPGKASTLGDSLPPVTISSDNTAPSGGAKQNDWPDKSNTETTKELALKDVEVTKGDERMDTEENLGASVIHSPVADSVALLRAANEEERRQLLANRETLEAENTELEGKVQQLSQSIRAQRQDKAELVQSVETTQQSIDAIHKFIEVFKT